MIWTKRAKIALAGLALAFALGAAAPAAAHAQAQASHQSTRSDDAMSAAEDKKIDEEEKDETAAYKHSPVVKKIGSMMGLSTETAAVLFEVFNFLVLFVLIGWAILKTAPKMFRDRTSAIQRQLIEARAATEEASVRLSSVEERLSHLDEQIAGMKSQAEKDLAADEARMKAAVEEETKKILAAADAEIAAAGMHAQRQLQQYAAELAIDQAAKKLVISAETDRLLVQGFARRLANDDPKGGQN